MNSDYIQVTAEEILSEFQLVTLTPSAVKVYVSIWNRMRYKGAFQLWLGDKELSVRARISVKLIPAVQSELARSGFMFLTPGATKMSYEFVENPDETFPESSLVGAENKR
jgi:hypothetical protein